MTTPVRVTSAGNLGVAIVTWFRTLTAAVSGLVPTANVTVSS